MSRRAVLWPTLVLALVVAGAGLDGQRAARRPAAQAPAPAPASPARDAALSPRNASYSIDAELDPASRMLTGRGVIAWRNVTARPTSELRLHLYWNAWRNTDSSWMRAWREAAGGAATHPQGDWSFIDVTAIRLLAGGDAPLADLTNEATFVAPDDGNTGDRTLLSVPLPRPVGPGETVTLDLAWTSRVPKTFARTGAVGDFFFIAHWFPKIGVLGDQGWAAHQFHAGTEFFADFGVYDVRLTVPRGWVVGATGRERERQDTPRGTTHRYVQEDVHDFAWTTSPDYIERTAVFEHPRLPRTELRLLLQPAHADQAERHFAAARTALSLFGEWFGPYPYGHLTIVDPAWESGAGGMEYPTLITAGTRWLAPATTDEPEDVVVHEVGHQFWHGLVATCEVEHAWMDEGLTQFSTARALHEAYTPLHRELRFFGGFVPWVLREAPLTRLDSAGLQYYRLAATSDVPATPSWRYAPESHYAMTYVKPALWLHTLERLVGWPRLQRGLSLYFTRARFTHPGPDDFFKALSEGAGRDLTWFFDQVHRSSEKFDYAVERLTTTDAGPRGYIDEGGTRRFAHGTARTGLWRTQVVVGRHGGAVFPVDVLVTFADGTTARERWDGRDRRVRFAFERPSPAVSAEVDPDHVLALDVDRTNNSWTLEPAAPKAARQWAGRWWLWLQDLVVTYGFFL